MKNLKKYVLVWCFSILCGFAYTQEKDLDALYNQAKAYYESKDLNKALEGGVIGLDAAESQENSLYMIHFKHLLGDVYRETGDFVESIDFFTQLIVDAENNNNLRGLADGYLSLSRTEYAMNAYNRASTSLVNAYNYYERLNDRIGQATVARRMGDMHYEEKHYTQAEEAYNLLVSVLRRNNRNPLIMEGYKGLLRAYSKTDNYNDGIPIAKRYESLHTGDPVDQAVAWGHLCEFYRLKGDYESSADMGRRALVVYKENIDYNLNLGQSYLKLGRIREARNHFDYVAKIGSLQKNREAVVMANLFLGQAALADNDEITAISKFGEAQKIASENQLFESLAMVYEEYISFYQGQNNTPEASSYRQKLQDVQGRITAKQNGRIARTKLADDEAARIEQLSRLRITEMEKQRLASRSKQLQEASREQEKALQQQQQTLELTEEEKRRLQEMSEEQGKQITQAQVEALLSQSRIVNLRDSLTITEEERRRVEQERQILTQQALIQQQEIDAAELRRQFLLTIAIISIIGLLAVIFLLIRMAKSKKVISHQNEVLEDQKERLKSSQSKLKNTLKNEQKVRKALQKTHSDLKATQAQLVHAEKMSGLGQLTAGIAHEINNPIGFIKGGMQTLELAVDDLYRVIEDYEDLSGKDSKDLKKELQSIKKGSSDLLLDVREAISQLFADIIFGADRVKEIVDGLRVFSRHDEAEVKMANVHENLDSALLILRSKFNEVAEITKEYDPNVTEIDCYPGQLNQVFVNLLTNAADAIDDFGKVTVKTVDLGDEVEIRFKDSGRGIAKEKLTKIFEPFYTTKDVGQGTGLGLSISYSIIKKHGGSIDVESKVRKGAEFILRLPKELNIKEEQDQSKSTMVEV